MKVVRPYGQSIVGVENKNRKLKYTTGKKIEPSQNLKNFEEFNSKNPRILIAQWISIIDKIILKPSDADKVDLKYIKNKASALNVNLPEDRRELINYRFDLSENDEFRRQQIDFRSKLGAACWNILKSSIDEKDHETYLRIWNWKLNPAGNNFIDFKNDKIRKNTNERGRPLFQVSPTPLKIVGNWYSSFVGQQSLSEVDFDLLTDDIYEHLHQSEKKKNGGFRSYSDYDSQDEKGFKVEKRGLITARALSISNNTLARRIEQKITGQKNKDFSSSKLQDLIEEIEKVTWSKEDEERFSKKWNLAAEIFEINRELENKRRRINARQSADQIFEHYRDQFAVDGVVPSRLEIYKENSGLLNLYDAVRSYYKRLLKNTKKGTYDTVNNQHRSRVSKILPKNDESLFSLLSKRQANAITNDLIRLGRVLHYSASDGLDDGFMLGNNAPIWKRNLDEIQDDFYWTTDGQSEIKRTEAFVRIWRHVLSVSARTARALGDPKGSILDDAGRIGDITSEDVAIKAAQQFDVSCASPDIIESAESHLKVLFGNRAGIFFEMTRLDAPEVDLQNFVFFLLRIVGWARNQAFHFKGRRGFVKKLSNVESAFGSLMKLSKTEYDHTNTVKAIAELLAKDQEERVERYWKECESAGMHLFADNEEIRNHLELVLQFDDTDISLPKFNSLLLRLENISLDDRNVIKKSLPKPASRHELKNDALRAKYVGLKQLYEKPFKKWVEENVKGDLLTGYIDDAVSLGTQAAIKINKNADRELIEAKPSMLRGTIEDRVSLQKYMEFLQQVQASEMRIQKGYESDSEAAKTQMEWVENFRKDIVARAYFDFLKSESSKTKWLMDLTGESRSNSAVVRPENVAQINTLTKPWHTAIYVLFHLSPADDISLLLHQFKKWSSLEGLKESDDGYDEIRDFQRLMSLYIDMHDDKQTGEGISRSFSDPFKEAFETDDDYKKIFITQGSDSDELGSTRRGLREILRFGHIKPLNSTLEKNRITSEDVTRLLSLEKLSSQNDKQSSPIAIAQKGRKELHKTITSGRRNASLEDSELYLEYLDTIEEHGNLARRVRFNDIIRLHRMMMRIASRLVDYAGTWERDGYFITLALMKLQGKTPCDIFMNNKAKDAFQDSKRWKWSSDLSDYKEDFGNLLHKFHSIDDHANQIRNNFAHFKYLSEDDVDLTNAVNDARCLLAYDRKLKNVVSKSIMDIVYQEGLLISWNMRTNGKRHDLVLDKIDSRMIKHLENKVPRNIAGKFKRSLHGNDYVAMVANIFR